VRAKIPFFNQPNLHANHPRPLGCAIHHLPQQTLQRLLEGNLEKKLRRTIRIKPLITRHFHSPHTLPRSDPDVHSGLNGFSYVRYVEPTRNSTLHGGLASVVTALDIDDQCIVPVSFKITEVKNMTPRRVAR